MDILKDENFESALNNLAKDFHLWNISKSESRTHLFLNDELSQRDHERKVRENLKSSHGPTAEQHDQFYRDHKLLLVLFRVLAVMPIERSGPGLVTFSWKSLASIYALCFYVLMTVVVMIVGIERIKFFETTDKFDDQIYGIIFILFLIPHFWIPFVGWGVASDVASYKTNWASFQVRYYRVTGENLKFPRLKMLIAVISIGCLICAVLFIVSMSILLEGFPMWQTGAYCEFVVINEMTCFYFLLLFFSFVN